MDTVVRENIDNLPAQQIFYPFRNTSPNASPFNPFPQNMETFHCQMPPRDFLWNIAYNDPLLQKKTSLMVVKGIKTTARFQNCGTAPIEVLQYRCRHRMDSVYGTSDANSTVALAFGFTDAEILGTDLAGAVSSPIDATQYGITPWMNPRFLKFCKVSKCKFRRLLPAQSFRLSFVSRKPRVIDLQRMGMGGTPNTTGSLIMYDQQRGDSYTLLIIRGTFAMNRTATLGYNRIGIGPCYVGAIFTREVRYAVTERNYQATALASQVPGLERPCFAPAPVVINQNMNAISTGPVPAAAGSNVLASNGIFGVVDTNQIFSS